MLTFSNAQDDKNHTIYNNLNNNDGMGAWDGMKMNTYAGLEITTGDANGNNPASRLKISGNWTGFPDNKTNAAEIANDTTGTYKKLMIVGNKSAGAERKVGVWDKLDVLNVS